MQVIDDTIDFSAYIEGPSENANVKPASHWLESVIEELKRPANLRGCSLPWEKTQNTVRIRSGELTIWPGANGHGKSLLVGQVMLDQMAKGQTVCIASMEMKPQETMLRMVRQAFGTSSPRVSDVGDFARWTDGKLWLYDQQNSVTPSRILAVARYCHTELKIGHIVIDNLMSCGIPEDGEGWQSKQKQFALDLSCHAHDTRQAVHLLAHVRKGQDENKPPSKWDVRGSAAITDLADNVHTVWRNKGKEAARDKGDTTKDDEPDALLIVDKNRHGGWEGRVQLWFDWKSNTFLGSEHEHPKAMQLMDEDAQVEF